jgi:HlyD family secretion protein
VEGNKAVKRTVEIGAVNDQWAEVMKGLVEGDKVVTSGSGRLRSGMDVTVQDVSNKNETDRSGETTLQGDRR